MCWNLNLLCYITNDNCRGVKVLCQMTNALCFSLVGFIPGACRQFCQ